MFLFMSDSRSSSWLSQGLGLNYLWYWKRGTEGLKGRRGVGVETHFVFHSFIHLTNLLLQRSSNRSLPIRKNLRVFRGTIYTGFSHVKYSFTKTGWEIALQTVKVIERWGTHFIKSFWPPLESSSQRCLSLTFGSPNLSMHKEFSVVKHIVKLCTICICDFSVFSIGFV